MVLRDDSASGQIDWVEASEWLARNYPSRTTWVVAFVVAAVFVASVLWVASAVGLDLVGWLYAVCQHAIASGEAVGGWLRG